jgi:hypothetical protein
MLRSNNQRKQHSRPKRAKTVLRTSKRKASTPKFTAAPPVWAVEVTQPPPRDTHAILQYSFGVNDFDFLQTKDPKSIVGDFGETSFEPESISPAEQRHVARQKRLLSKLHIEDVRTRINTKTIDKHRLIEKEFVEKMANGTIKLVPSAAKMRKTKQLEILQSGNKLTKAAAEAIENEILALTTPDNTDTTITTTTTTTPDTSQATDQISSLTSASSKKKPKHHEKSHRWLMHLNGEWKEYSDLNEWPLADFPNGHSEPALWGPKHHIKPAYNSPSAHEQRVLHQVDPSPISTWGTMRPLFRGQNVEFIIPGPGPLASKAERMDWRDDLVDLQHFFRFWDPRYVSPDPYTMKMEGGYPFVYAFNDIPTNGQLMHPDYKKLTRWFYWPEYLPNRLQAQQNIKDIRADKPFLLTFFNGVNHFINFADQMGSLFLDMIEKIPRFMTPGRFPDALRKIGKGIKHELQHFGHGFSRLASNVSLSAKTLFTPRVPEKGIQRSEKILIVKTVFDVLRLIPLIIILVIPFLEFALPLLLKLFPNMLPSTFADKKAAKTKAFQEFKVRLQLSKYLEHTLSRTILRQLQSQSGLIQDISMDPHILTRFETMIKKQKHDQQAFRSQRGPSMGTSLPADYHEETDTTADESTTEMTMRPLTDEIEQLSINVYGHESAPIATLLHEMFARLSKGESVESAQLQPLFYLFSKTVNFDTLRHPQLETLCRFMNIPNQGDANTLKNNITRHLDSLRKEDQAIRSEGIENLSISDLQAACSDRGMRYNGVKKRNLRKQLENWIYYSLDLKLPPTLLILSRAFSLLDEIKKDPRFQGLRSTDDDDNTKPADADHRKEISDKVASAAAKAQQNIATQINATAVAGDRPKGGLTLQQKLHNQIRRKLELQKQQPEQSNKLFDPEPYDSQRSLRFYRDKEDFSGSSEDLEDSQEESTSPSLPQQKTTTATATATTTPPITTATSATTPPKTTPPPTTTPPKKTTPPTQPPATQLNTQQAQIAHELLSKANDIEAALLADQADVLLNKTTTPTITKQMLPNKDDIAFIKAEKPDELFNKPSTRPKLNTGDDAAAKQFDEDLFEHLDELHELQDGRYGSKRSPVVSQEQLDIFETEQPSGASEEFEDRPKLSKKKPVLPPEEAAKVRSRQEARARGEIAPEVSSSSASEEESVHSEVSSSEQVSDADIAAHLTKELGLSGSDGLTARDIEILRRRQQRQLGQSGSEESDKSIVAMVKETSSEEEDKPHIKSVVKNKEGEYVPAQDLDMLFDEVSSNIKDKEKEKEPLGEAIKSPVPPPTTPKM